MSRWLRVSEACQYASLSRNTLKKMLREGMLTGERSPGGHWRIDRESIDEWFGKGKQKAVAVIRSLKL